MSRHLAPEEFIDLLDGGLTESDLPHLQACELCRAQLASLQQTWQAATEVDVPEPSPLFWDHFSARVHDAVAAEPVRGSRWSWLQPSWQLAALTSALAAVALIFAIGLRHPSERPQVGASIVAEESAAPVAAPSAVPVAIEDDEPLALVADLASELDWDSAAELGWATRGGAERVVVDMTDEERLELQRLLTDAIGSGA